MKVDIAIVGAGIAGASLAWHAAGGARVAIIEAESQPGMHSTGRSAAMFMESYGPPQVRALTRAARSFYDHPPDGFTDSPLVSARGALYVARPGQEAALGRLRSQIEGSGCRIDALTAPAVLDRVPVLRRDRLAGGLLEPDALDIDVHALHHGFLRGARRRGAELWVDALLQQAVRDGSGWTLRLADGRELQATVLVDAAGAWADEVARRCGVEPLGIQPCRRSAFTFDPPAGVDPRGWPTVAGVDEDWYFKPDAGLLLGSPANADPVAPHDVAPEEIDIALGIARIEDATTMSIRRPRRSWAGLRSFAPDGELVIGFDALASGFFWLAGQGGYGIQSAAGAAALAHALIAGRALPEALARQRVDPVALAPGRLRPG